MKRTADDDQSLFERALTFIWQPKKAHTEKDFEFFNVLAQVADGALLARILCQLDKESLLRACQVSQIFNEVCKKYQLVERRHDGHIFIYRGSRFQELAPEWDQFHEEKVVSVACSPGEVFCVYATESGRLFRSDMNGPVVIPNNEKAIRVYCNDAEVMFITSAGNAYAFLHSRWRPTQMYFSHSYEPELIGISSEKKLFFIQGAMNNYSMSLLTDEGVCLIIRQVGGQVYQVNYAAKHSKIVDMNMNDIFLVTNHEDGYSAFYVLNQTDLQETIYKNGETFTVVHPDGLLATTKDGRDYYIRKDQIGMPLSVDMLVGSDTKYMHKTEQGEIRLTRKNQLFIDGKLFDFKMGISQVAIGYNISVLIAHLDPIMPLVCGHCGVENPPYFAGNDVYCGEECLSKSFLKL